MIGRLSRLASTAANSNGSAKLPIVPATIALVKVWGFLCFVAVGGAVFGASGNLAFRYGDAWARERDKQKRAFENVKPVETARP